MIPAPPACDSLYVAPAAGEISFSCGGRIVWERRQGLRILVVTLRRADAAPARDPRSEALRAFDGVEHLALDVPSAAAPVAETLAEVLNDLFHRTRARHLYAPLAVRSDPDHRLCHEAARAAFTAGEGRSVFLYEERPEALVPGAVRIRLGQLGVRLPPAAAEAAERVSLLHYLARVNVPPAFRGESGGWVHRLRELGRAAGQWRASRAWHPLRSFGPRLQPVVYPTSPELLNDVRMLIGSLEPPVQALADAYARRLGGPPHAERYWLLLPPRAADGLENLPPALGA